MWDWGQFVLFDYYLLICFYLFLFFGSALRAVNQEEQGGIGADYVFFLLFTHLFLLVILLWVSTKGSQPRGTRWDWDDLFYYYLLLFHFLLLFKKYSLDFNCFSSLVQHIEHPTMRNKVGLGRFCFL